MEHASDRLMTYTDRGSQGISMPCHVLCLIILLVLGFLPILPGNLTIFFRPAFILMCLVCSHSGRYRFGAEKWMLINLAYYIVIFFAFPITASSFETVVSMELFGLFFILAACRPWNRREIKLMYATTAVACCICAVVVLYSNPSLLHSSGDQHVNYLSVEINRNTMAFSVVPGALCGAAFMLWGKRRLPGAAALMLCSYTAFALGCRSAFYSLIIGLFLIFWEKSRGQTTRNGRFAARIGMIAAAFIVLLIVFYAADGTYSQRLFDISDSSGRDKIWDTARSLIRQKPVFGGGYDYWASSGNTMGTHNTFLTVMLSSGYVGGALLACFLLAAAAEMIRGRNLIPLAFAAELFCHTYTEPGMDYYAYIPLVLAYILVRYSRYKDPNISRLLI